MAIFSSLPKYPVRVAILVLLMVSFSPAGHASGAEDREEIPTVVVEDILDTYSRSVSYTHLTLPTTPYV